MRKPSRREREILRVLAFREDLGQAWAVPETGSTLALVVPTMMEGSPLERHSAVSKVTLRSLNGSGLVSLQWVEEVPKYGGAKPGGPIPLGAHKVTLTDEGRAHTR